MPLVTLHLKLPSQYWHAQRVRSGEDMEHTHTHTHFFLTERERQRHTERNPRHQRKKKKEKGIVPPPPPPTRPLRSREHHKPFSLLLPSLSLSSISPLPQIETPTRTDWRVPHPRDEITAYCFRFTSLLLFVTGESISSSLQ